MIVVDCNIFRLIDICVNCDHLELHWCKKNYMYIETYCNWNVISVVQLIAVQRDSNGHS